MEAVLFFLTRESNGMQLSAQGDTERRLTLAALLFVNVPLWTGLRFGLDKARLSGKSFQLYANAVSLSFFGIVLAGGSVFVRYGSLFETPQDWMLRGTVAFLLIAAPRLSEQRTLSAFVQSIVIALATEIVAYVALAGAGYKCNCYKTLSLQRVDIILTHAMFWMIVILATC